MGLNLFTTSVLVSKEKAVQTSSREISGRLFFAIASSFRSGSVTIRAYKFTLEKLFENGGPRAFEYFPYADYLVINMVEVECLWA